MDINVKIISPQNEVTELKYSDILYFCQRVTEKFISKSEENLKLFRDFRKDYNHFEPYFDFVVSKLKYILINPIFYKNTYLLPYKDKYYIMDLAEDDSYSYDELINKIPCFSFDFLPSNDINIYINDNNDFIKERIGFYLDEDGVIYKNYMVGRHLKMGALILNQKMIASMSTCFKYKLYIRKHGENRLCDFLVDELGYILGFPSDEKTIVYNSKVLSNIQLKYLNKFKIKYNIKEEDNNRKFR